MALQQGHEKVVSVLLEYDWRAVQVTSSEMLQSRDQSGLDTRVLISISVLASMPERSQRHSGGENFGHGLAGLVSFNVTGE